MEPDALRLAGVARRTGGSIVHESSPADSPVRQLRRLTHLLLNQAPQYDLREVAELAGVDLEETINLWRSLGHATPELSEAMFTDSDIEALRISAGLHDAGVRLELPLARALGLSMARMAEWQADLLWELSIASNDSAPLSVGGSSGEVTDRSLEVTFAVLLPTWERLQQHVWRRHLLAAIGRRVTHPEPAAATNTTVIGFADIAEFTSNSRGLTEARLAAYIEDFETAASLVVTDRGGRVIKTIGDEVMFAVDDPRTAADIALTLAQRLSDLDGRAELHVGLAYGPVLRRLGDYYGTVVNLASRLTALARPGTVLVDRAMADALADHPEVHIRQLRSLALRGFPSVEPWLLRSAHRA